MSKNRQLKNYVIYGCNKVEIKGENLTESDRTRYILVLTGLASIKSQYDILHPKDKKHFNVIYSFIKSISKNDYNIYIPKSLKNSHLLIFESNKKLYTFKRGDWKNNYGRLYTKNKTDFLLHKIVSEVYCKNNNIKKEFICITKDMVE